jgi:1,6-anhydro-N-acetylmuramate kinase
MNVLGVMSGTSADGVDAVLVSLEEHTGSLRWEVLARHAQDYAPELRARLLAALKPETSDVVALTLLHAELGEVYAEVVCEVQKGHRVDAVAQEHPATGRGGHRHRALPAAGRVGLSAVGHGRGRSGRADGGVWRPQAL